MNPSIVKILECDYITHDVKRFRVEKPEGFSFIPGQSVGVSINTPEWKNEIRPFTFTSLNDWKYLEFIIKIYDNHQGVTRQLGRTHAGAELILHEVFGTLVYKDQGVFIAGGAGVTPFIAIIRELYNTGRIAGNKLILSNKTLDDIILPQELTQMLGADFINILTRQGVIGFIDRRIDRKMLIDVINDFSVCFYVCGPRKFVTQITALLLDLGAKSDSIIFEE